MRVGRPPLRSAATSPGRRRAEGAVSRRQSPSGTPSTQLHHDVRLAEFADAGINEPRDVRVIQPREDLPLHLEPIAGDFGRQALIHELDGDVLVELAIRAMRQIHRGHAAGAQQAIERVRPEPHSAGQRRDARSVEQRVRGFVRVEQGQDLLGAGRQCLRRARRRSPPAPPAAASAPRGRASSMSRHRSASLSLGRPCPVHARLISHARAIVQSRSTVASDTCSASAVSSLVMPAKNFISTTRALRASVAARASSAASRSSRSSDRRVDEGQAVRDREFRGRTPSFLGRPRARVIDQDAPHDVRGGAEEVDAVLPADAALIDQLEVDLVHERRRRERVIGPLAAQNGPREAPEVVVDDRRELVERASSPSLQRSSRSVTSGPDPLTPRSMPPTGSILYECRNARTGLRRSTWYAGQRAATAPAAPNTARAAAIVTGSVLSR